MSDLPQPIGVPRGGLDLLVRAALAPEEEARSAWRSWRATHDLDTTSWSEVRMLAAVAGRIAALEEDADARPRIEGIRKFLWVQTRMCLEPARTGLATLVDAGIPVLIMKGAARVIADPTSAHERLIRDVDALVPLGSEERSLELLRSDGWTLCEPPWAVQARKAGKVAGHHAWTVAKPGSEIDLHHFSNFLNRLTGDDDGLWRRATAFSWRGVSVFLPSPADSLVMAVTHGVRWSLDGATDWTVDAARLVDAGDVDWDIVLEEADSRLLHAVLHAGLDYLAEALRRPIPRHVLDALARGCHGIARAELAAYASAAVPRTIPEIQAALTMAGGRALRRAGIDALSSDEPLAAGPLAEARSEIPPGKVVVVCPTPKAGMRGWLVLRVELDTRPFPSGYQFTGQARAPGIMVGCCVGALHRRPAGGEFVRFEFQLPAALVTLRHLNQVAVSVGVAGRHFLTSDAVPVSVTWFQRGQVL